MDKAEKSNLHKDHRQRVRKRFINEGSLDNFEYHQILELLLFFTVPRRDTNEIAHKMINQYGSFYNLLNAKPEDIMKRCKVSETTAVLVSMIPHISRKYLNSKWDTDDVVICNLSIAAEYFNSLLAGQPFESFYMLCMDINKKLLRSVKISDGNVDSSHIYIEKVVEMAMLYNSSFAIIGHNHPSGTLKPSGADVAATEKIKAALSMVNIVLLDHVVVCGEKYFSFAQKNLCNLKY